MNLLWILLLSPALAFAKPPDWVASEGKSPEYPASGFFTGFGESMLDPDNDRGKCMQLAQDNAGRRLIQSVKVTMKSAVFSKQEQRDQDYSQYLSAELKSASELDIGGLKTETFFDEKKKICYALAAADKRELARSYAEKSAALREEVSALAASGRSYEEKGEKSPALSAYLRARQKLREYREARALAALAGAGADPGAQSLPALAELAKAADRLAAQPIRTLDDAAGLLAFCLKAQSDLPEGKVMVQPFTFRDTRMGSPFARYFKQLLESRLVDIAKWSVAEQTGGFSPKTGDPARDSASASGADYVLVGAYWMQGSDVRLIGKLRRVSSGEVLAASEATVPGAVMAASKLQTQPENYAAALRDQRLFGAGEHAGGGLVVEAWTNKGADDLLFSRGEKMKVFVRMNLPGYVRLLYHLADGKRALLLDNYYLDEAKVNTAYELPQEFECDAPFGAETLQVFGSTRKFDSVQTKSVDGYDILAEDLGQALAKTRGMKKTAPGTQKAETRLVITTMEK